LIDIVTGFAKLTDVPVICKNLLFLQCTALHNEMCVEICCVTVQGSMVL